MKVEIIRKWKQNRLGLIICSSIILLVFAIFAATFLVVDSPMSPSTSRDHDLIKLQDPLNLNRSLWIPAKEPHVYESARSRVTPSEDINFDPPTDLVRFQHSEWRLALDIPYNPNWGTKERFISPYTVHADTVVFGPITGCPPGGLCRLNRIRRRPAQSVKVVRENLMQRQDECKRKPCTVANLEEVVGESFTAFIYKDPLASLEAIEVDVVAFDAIYSIRLPVHRAGIQTILNSITVPR